MLSDIDVFNVLRGGGLIRKCEKIKSFRKMSIHDPKFYFSLLQSYILWLALAVSIWCLQNALRLIVWIWSVFKMLLKHKGNEINFCLQHDKLNGQIQVISSGNQNWNHQVDDNFHLFHHYSIILSRLFMKYKILIINSISPLLPFLIQSRKRDSFNVSVIKVKN